MSKKTNVAKQQTPRKPKVARSDKRKRRNPAKGRVVELKPSAGLKTALNDPEFMTLLLRTICRYIELTVPPTGKIDAEFEGAEQLTSTVNEGIPGEKQIEKAEN